MLNNNKNDNIKRNTNNINRRRKNDISKLSSDKYDVTFADEKNSAIAKR